MLREQTDIVLHFPEPGPRVIEVKKRVLLEYGATRVQVIYDGGKVEHHLYPTEIANLFFPLATSITEVTEVTEADFKFL